ncbi:MAG TPA: ABC transporter ATP-binding protein [Aggregatilineales bacterium]|nr:ABC transporter ATP-binding protein [Aggregatilineales bacterium]HPV05992.1 ABC transporter ATP-binding protein [Aggregatilineales bacterium]
MTDNTLPSASKRLQHLEMRGITKRFPGVLANNNVNFDVRAGEIHALLGENGAGKSTLMKILFGLYQPDEGEIRINGEPVRITCPADAIGYGIGMVHQHFMLVPSFTVAENVALGLKSERGPLLDLDTVAARITELSKRYSLRVYPNEMVWQLSVGEQQRVEIIKALYREAALLVLDEPTAVLTPQEVDELFVVLRELVSQGHSIIFISHKLHEVLTISDRVTVLRDGSVIDTVETKNTTREELARLMVGRDVVLGVTPPPQEPGEVRLQIEDLWAESDKEGVPALRGVSLDVRAGEIVGIAGVSGNGQRELAQVICGLRPATKGRVLIDGKDVTGFSPEKLLNVGLSYIPEERLRDGGIRDFTCAENLILRDHTKPPFAKGIFLDLKAIASEADRLIKVFNVKTPSRDTPLKNLSGGNIQKLILARELSRKPRVLIAAQPTRGVDIGAMEYIHRQLVAERSEGTATLLISEDLDEIQNLCDRIAVMYEGRIMGIVKRGEADVKELGLMMAGVRREEALGAATD